MTSRSVFCRRLGVAVIAASGFSPPALATTLGATRNLRFGHSASIESPHHAFALRFARDVFKKTQGAVAIEVFPNEVLGSNPELLAAQQTGMLDFALPTTTMLANIDPRFLIASLPYLFGSVQSAYAVLDGPIFARYARGLPAKGIRVLAFSTNGLRDITSLREPIMSPGDLANLRIRVAGNGLSFAFFLLLGAVPVTIPFSELRRGLIERQADAQENPLVNISASRLYDAQRYLALTRHQFEGLALTISERTWNASDASTRRSFSEASCEAAALHRIDFQTSDDAALSKLRAHGMSVTKPAAEPFIEVCRPLYGQMTMALGEDVLRAVEKAAQTGFRVT